MDYNNKKYALIGLANLGNTCFLNSALQCLLHIPELNTFLNNESYISKLNNLPDSVILKEYNELRKLMWTNEHGVMRPGKFLSAVQQIAKIKNKDIFTGFAQNDLPEFLLFIIDCFNNAIKRSVVISYEGNPKNDKDKLAISCYTTLKKMYENEYSEMLKIFYGIHVSIVNASTQEKNLLSTSPEPFFILSLSIPMEKQNISLYDCLDLYTIEEKLTGENKYIANETTGEKVDATKRILFWNFPDVLIIDLKRFFFNGNRYIKYTGNIFFSATDVLDLSKYVVGYNAQNYLYELIGVCNHMGGLMGGHYTAYVKYFETKEWYSFNDSQVSQLKTSDVTTNNAYCLFYRKITNK